MALIIIIPSLFWVLINFFLKTIYLFNLINNTQGSVNICCDLKILKFGGIQLPIGGKKFLRYCQAVKHFFAVKPKKLVELRIFVLKLVNLCTSG